MSAPPYIVRFTATKESGEGSVLDVPVRCPTERYDFGGVHFVRNSLYRQYFGSTNVFHFEVTWSQQQDRAASPVCFRGRRARGTYLLNGQEYPYELEAGIDLLFHALVRRAGGFYLSWSSRGSTTGTRGEYSQDLHGYDVGVEHGLAPGSTLTLHVKDQTPDRLYFHKWGEERAGGEVRVVDSESPAEPGAVGWSVGWGGDESSMAEGSGAARAALLA